MPRRVLARVSSTLSTLRQILPLLSAMACQALVQRLSNTCEICDSLASIVSLSVIAPALICIEGGRVARIMRTDSSISGLTACTLKSGVSRRVKSRICLTSSLARVLALAISLRLVIVPGLLPRSSRANCRLPVMAPRILLKSCAMPPESVPSASIFCASRICASSSALTLSAATCSLISRRITENIRRPATIACEIEASTGNSLPSLRIAWTLPVRPMLRVVTPSSPKLRICAPCV